MVFFNSHYDVGFLEVFHRDKKTVSPVGLPTWDNYIEDLKDIFEYEVGYIPAGYEHRPDLISELFFDTPTLWWLILLANNVTDPFEGLNVGDRVLIPKDV